MKRWNIDIAAAAAAVLIFAMGVLPAESQEAARLRCQKSGCREGGVIAVTAAADDDNEPTLIVTKKSSSAKAFPFLTKCVAAFLVLRLAAHYIRKLFPIFRRKTPEIRAVVCRCCNSIFLKSGRSLLSRRASSASLGSLADLLDDSSRDSSSAPDYSSVYSNTSSEGDSNDDKSSALESQSESAFSGQSLSDSSAGSTCDDTHKNSNDKKQSKGRESISIVSKFLKHISESNTDEQQHHNDPQRKNGHGHVRRRPSLDYITMRHSHNSRTVGLYNQSGSRNRRHTRRSTMDGTNSPSFRSQFGTTERSKQQRKESSSNTTSERSQSKTPAEGVQKRKAAAADVNVKTTGQNPGKSDSNGKTKKTSKTQQHQMQHTDKEESKKNSSLHHHLSKFSSPNNEDDNEHYSTMLSTVDLRSRATRFSPFCSH